VNSSRSVVSDTSPLISLEKIDGGYEWIRQLYDVILVPPAVLEELAAGMFESERAYIAHFGITDLLRVDEPENPNQNATWHLDPGEREAIALAVEHDLEILIEEEAGRAVARELGLGVSGVAGQILRAVREGITSVETGHQMLVELREKGRINQEVFESVRVVIRDEA